MYHIILKKPAKKFIDRLPADERKRVVDAIEKLPEGEDIKPMKGIPACSACVSVSIA